MHVLEWSQSSNGFHIQPLEKSIQSNKDAFTEDRRSNYIVVGIGSHDAMTELAEELRPILEYRNAARRDSEPL